MKCKYLLFLFSIFLFGCGTIINNVYHEVEIPTDDLSRLFIDNKLAITKCDETEVDWNISVSMFDLHEYSRAIVVNIQPGIHAFTVNLYANYIYSSISADNLKISFNFIEGKNYYIYPDINTDKRTVVLKIEEVTSDNEYKNRMKFFKLKNQTSQKTENNVPKQTPLTFEKFDVDILQYPHMLLIDNPPSGQFAAHYTFTDNNSSYQLRYSLYKQTEKDYPNIRRAYYSYILPIVWNAAGYEENKMSNFNDNYVKKDFNGDFGSFVLIQNPGPDYGKGFKYIMLHFYYKINQGMVVQSLLFNDISFYINKNYKEIFNSFKFLD